MSNDPKAHPYPTAVVALYLLEDETMHQLIAAARDCRDERSAAQLDAMTAAMEKELAERKMKMQIR